MPSGRKFSGFDVFAAATGEIVVKWFENRHRRHRAAAAVVVAIAELLLLL